MSTPGVTPEFAQAYCAMMLDGLAREVETTKKVLAAIPDDKSDYRPDPNGRSAWELAWHLANTDIQFLDGIADLKFNMANPAGSRQAQDGGRIGRLVRPQFQTRRRIAFAPCPREQLRLPSISSSVFNLPAAIYLGFLNNHSIHHRGELCTYLRPMGSKCPSIYGGSYDEPLQLPDADSTAA